LQRSSRILRSGEALVGLGIRVDGNDLSLSLVRQIVESLLPEVPVQHRKKVPEPGFDPLAVDRDGFVLELARELVCSSLLRSPVC
jgi:hypothetical protein